jgi:hypothetical protein
MKFAKDRWISLDPGYAWFWPFKYDKMAHAVGGFSLSLCLGFLSALWVLFANIIFWILWEIKDGFILVENLPSKWKWWGGDGFSYKDLICSIAGAIIGILPYLVLQ